MNSRQRRKQAAQEHNDRIGLVRDLGELKFAIYVKHGARITPLIDGSNDSVRREIARLRGILEADTPPPRPAPSRSVTNARIAMAFMAWMGAIR